MAIGFTKVKEHKFPENNGGISKLGQVLVAPDRQRQLQMYDAVLCKVFLVALRVI